MRLPPPRTSAALAVQQLAVRHTATALLGATAARTAAEMLHRGQGQVSPESIEDAIRRYAILLRSALGSVRQEDC